jgi:hypothetical protein
MSYYINEKEVGYAEYINYLETIVCEANKFLQVLYKAGFPSIFPLVDEAVNIINENKERR